MAIYRYVAFYKSGSAGSRLELVYIVSPEHQLRHMCLSTDNCTHD